MYDEHVVETQEGNGYLEKTGIKDHPYSIFSEELQRERKRRKRDEEQRHASHSNSRSGASTSHENSRGARGLVHFILVSRMVD